MLQHASLVALLQRCIGTLSCIHPCDAGILSMSDSVHRYRRWQQEQEPAGDSGKAEQLTAAVTQLWEEEPALMLLLFGEVFKGPALASKAAAAR